MQQVSNECDDRRAGIRIVTHMRDVLVTKICVVCRVEIYMSEHRNARRFFLDDLDGFRRIAPEARGDGGLRTSCPPSELLPPPRRQLEPP